MLIFFIHSSSFFSCLTDLKLMAIVASEFEKVLWVDADAFILRNVSYIASQTLTGTLFWRDTHRTRPDNPIWSLLNVSEPDEGLALESGILYIDKAMKWRVLYTAAYMNQKQHIYYSLLHGDKDTFRMACIAAKEECSLIPYGLLLLGKTTEEFRRDVRTRRVPEGGFKGYIFLQPDVDGRPVCVHLSVGGKKFALPMFKRENKRAFTYIRSYDPNRAHLAPIGSVREVVVDEGPFYGPLYNSTVALGQFEETLGLVYIDAIHFFEKYNVTGESSQISSVG